MRDTEVNKFLRASEQRLTSAGILFRHQMYLDSMYLAGSSVECSLKAVILANLPLRNRAQFRQRFFRGTIAHDFEFLKGLLARRKVRIPLHIAQALRPFASWSTQLRYEVSRKTAHEANRYLLSARSVLEWAERSV